MVALSPQQPGRVPWASPWAGQSGCPGKGRRRLRVPAQTPRAARRRVGEGLRGVPWPPAVSCSEREGHRGLWDQVSLLPLRQQWA